MKKRLALRVPAVLAGLMGLAGLAAAQENLSSWQYFKPVTINTKASGANVPAAVTNIPVLVRLGAAQAAVFTQAKAGGADIRFRRLPGPQLPYQIERWDAVGQVAEIWVLVDSVKGNDSSTAFNMYWGKADAAPASDGGAVFAASQGFMAVWHLGGTGPRANSVTGGNPATPVNYTGQSWPGVIAGADSLRGGDGPPGANATVNDYLDLGAGYANFDAGLTYSIWAYPSEVRSWSRFLSMGNGNTDIALFRRDLTDSLQFRCLCPGVAGPTAAAIDLNTWQHFAAVREPGDFGTVHLYKNGVELVTAPSSGDLSSAIQNTIRSEAYIGRSNNSSTEDNDYYAGKVDEPQLSGTARSGGWIKLSYENQKPGSTILALGATGTPTNVAAAAADPGSLSIRSTGRGVVFEAAGNDAARLRVSVVDARGRAVWSRSLRGGAQSVAWNGKTAGGTPVAAGAYVARLTLADAAGNSLGRLEKTVAVAP